MHYMIWDVNRVLLPIYGSIGIRWYSLFFMAGFVFGYFATLSMARKEGVNLSLADTLLNYMIVGTIVGARLGHCLFYEPDEYMANPLKILEVWEGGLASHGGYLGALLAVVAFSYYHRGPGVWWLLDRLTIMSLLAGGFIRLGNLFNSEIIGRVTDVPWAFIFVQVDPLPRHPSQLYEAAGYFLISLILYGYYRWQKRRPLSGSVLGLGMILGFSFRIWVETFKENQSSFENAWWLNLGQILSFPYILIGFLLFFGLLQKTLLSMRLLRQ